MQAERAAMAEGALAAAEAALRAKVRGATSSRPPFRDRLRSIETSAPVSATLVVTVHRWWPYVGRRDNRGAARARGQAARRRGAPRRPRRRPCQRGRMARRRGPRARAARPIHIDSHCLAQDAAASPRRRVAELEVRRRIRCRFYRQWQRSFIRLLSFTDAWTRSVRSRAARPCSESAHPSLFRVPLLRTDPCLHGCLDLSVFRRGCAHPSHPPPPPPPPLRPPRRRRRSACGT